MRHDPSTLVQAVLKRIFDNPRDVEVKAWHNQAAIAPNVTAEVRFHFDGLDLQHALREGDRAFVELVKEGIGGGRLAWDEKLRMHVRGREQERARHLSLKAGRRTGAHKRVPEARAA